MPAENQAQVYQSDDCEVDLGRRELRARGVPVPIGGKAFELIEVLVRAEGDLVTKDELMDRVWPGAIVGDNTLQVHISAVRKALGPYRTMLKTESGRGYRLHGSWTVRPGGSAPATIARQQIAVSREPAATNLPIFGLDLIGRSAAAQRLQDLVSAYRLVTLTGPGGIGKTSLALEVARGLRTEFQHGGWFVDLAPLSDPDLVPSAVAGVLGLKLAGEETSAEAVARAIGGNNLLLILDNCEHVIDAAAKLTEMLVRYCPRTSILATSREVLRIDGEYVYRVPPLDVPARQHQVPNHILACSAVELFVARAQALDSNFSPDTKTLPLIGIICQHLDGIPLAIEFAAARAAMLGIQQVAIGLRDRFALLTGGRRTAVPRHRTLRATLDWSYKLLPETEQALLRRLSVFRADFTFDAAAAVAGDTRFDTSTLADGITNLVSKSLVAIDKSEAEPRWRLLETIRTYAFEKLVENGEHEHAAQRHAEYYRDLFASPAPDSSALLSNEDLNRYGREMDNVRAALDWCFSSTGDVAAGIDLTAAYAPAWLHVSLAAECRDRCDLALRNIEPFGNSKVRQHLELLTALGSALRVALGPVEQTQAVQTRALELAQNLGDLHAQARVLWSLSSTLVFHGEYGQARTAMEQLTQVAHRIGDPAITVVADRLMGNTLLTIGRPREAQQCFERVLRTPVPPVDQRRTIWYYSDDRAMARAMLARALCLQGFLNRARFEAQSSVEDLHGTDHLLSFCRVLYYGLCRVALMVGDVAAADRAIARFVDTATNLNVPFWTIVGRFLEGKLLTERREFAKAATVLRETFDICDRTGWRASYPEFKGALAMALAGLGQFDDALDTVEQAITAAGHGQDGQVWYVPELLRIKGELLLQQTTATSVAAAEDCLTQAGEMAREHGALFWELRIAITFAGLRMTQNRKKDARNILAPVYGRFTEGFEMADLRAARSLLESLPI